jgi:hypothetical protein
VGSSPYMAFAGINWNMSRIANTIDKILLFSTFIILPLSTPSLLHSRAFLQTGKALAKPF